MSIPKINVVVIEDDKPIRRFIRSTLDAQQMIVWEAETGHAGLHETTLRKIDLVIVDLGLPDMDGVDVISALRAWSKVPIIVLSARSEERDKVNALDAGADDYLTKPFGVPELLARIRAQLRRAARTDRGESAIVNFGTIRVDLAARRVTRANQPVHLTPIEYRLLAMLAQHAGRVLTHRQLLQEVWGRSHLEDGHYLRIHMGHLRQKLEADPAQPAHLLTETGVGYRLEGAE